MMKIFLCIAAIAISASAQPQNRPALSLTISAATNSPTIPDVTKAPPRTSPLDRVGATLTPENRVKLDAINKAYAEKGTPIYARLGTARRELENLIAVDKPDDAAIRGKAKEIGDLEADLAVARAERYAKLREFVPADQARRMNIAFPIQRPFQPSMNDNHTPQPSISPAK